MNSMPALAARLPAYVAFRRLGGPRHAAASTWWSAPRIAATRAAAPATSGARTTQRLRHDEPDLTLDELERVFASLGRAPLLPDLQRRRALPARRTWWRSWQRLPALPARRHHHPHQRPAARAHRRGGARRILRAAPRGPGHHQPVAGWPGRGARPHPRRARQLGAGHAHLEGLRALKRYPNLVLGIHTVVSRFNVDRLPEIAARADGAEPGQLHHRGGRGAGGAGHHGRRDHPVGGTVRRRRRVF